MFGIPSDNSGKSISNGGDIHIDNIPPTPPGPTFELKVRYDAIEFRRANWGRYAKRAKTIRPNSVGLGLLAG
jgi:hypothetical protein